MEEIKISKHMTVNDAIKNYPSTIAVFSRFNIDSCCGGASSIEEAAKRDGADADELMQVLEETVAKNAGE